MKNKIKAEVKKGAKKMSAGAKVAIGAGVAAVGAGAYYFLGPKGKAHQAKAKAFMVKMEKEIKAKAEKVKDMSEPVYHDIVDAMEKKYSAEYKAHKGDIQKLAKVLKTNWKKVKKTAKSKVK